MDPANERSQWLAVISGFSRFLSEELLRHPEWLPEISEIHRAFSAADYQRRLTEFAAATGADLAQFRRRELLRIAIRDALQLAPLGEITGEISHLADAILEGALAIVTKDLRARHGVPVTKGVEAAFTVLALGKLGGRELNYSSDIDLMFLYSGNGETSGPQKITNKEFFKKAANQYTSLLSAHTAAGLCYRVDLRLRPEGRLGDVVMPLAAAKEYYSKRARDWELQMLIKARVAAGDPAAGEELLAFVEPLIYSTTLDFSMIESMSATRERIGEKRARKDERNVKLTRGGIRDIEFLVQCLQRLHGAREPAVRHGGTLHALSLLLEKDLLSATECARLTEAYCFLRQLEHRLQLEDDRQTHSLPSDPLDLDRIARRMPGIDSSALEPPYQARLLQELNRHLESAQNIYDRIVHAQRPLYYSPISSVIPSLVSSGEMMGTDMANERPQVADYTSQLAELSPFLSAQIAQRPELLDDLRQVAEQPAKASAFEALAAPLNDLDALQRFYRREMFRVQSASICLPEPVFQTLDRTSALTEFLIARAYRIALGRALAHAHTHATAEKPFEDPRNEMMVAALGRLGMREFDLGSDADLLFIIPDSEAPRQRFWTRVAEHLIEILTAYTGEGALLSLDTRLRPNGREGMLVQTESKYVDYFSSQAEAWEGIAYMKARGVAGDTERATGFLRDLQRADWRRWGQSGRSKQNLFQMRLRLQREQGRATPLKAGEGGYYDADFILMYLRLKGGGMFFKSLNTPERIEIVERMGHLERGDAEFLLRATTYYRALDHAIRLVTGRAQAKLPDCGEERERIAKLMHRWTDEQPTAASLESDLSALQAQMRQLFESIFGS
ncbi:MAG TPA: glutamine-synthetase adenylyltransferase [Bryobacteraceae bacterium]